MVLKRVASIWSTWSSRALWLGGVVLFAMCIALAQWSDEVWSWAWVSNRGLYALVGFKLLAGMVYLVVVGGLRNAKLSRWGIAWIVLAGLLMRLVLLPSSPGRGSDSIRYMWDGALTANGLSPYRHTPQEGKLALNDANSDPRLRAVAESAGPNLGWMNHPDVKTIYPPVAQAAFVVAYWIAPWSGTAWRAVLLVFDLATLVLLLLLLRRFEVPLAWLAIYWWNPLLIHEFYDAGHLDTLVLPFVLGALLLAGSNRPIGSSLCLAVAVATKLWPIILLPLILRPLLRKPGQLTLAASAFVLAAALLFCPMLLAGSSGLAGTQLYAATWQANDGLFQLITRAWRNILPWIGYPAWRDQLAARITAPVLLLLWILWLARKPLGSHKELAEAFLLVTAGSFLLSPTQFPWYYTWLVPLLALRPRWSLLLYTALLPLFLLHWRLHQGWVWVQHVPVWALLATEMLWRRPRFESSEEHLCQES